MDHAPHLENAFNFIPIEHSERRLNLDGTLPEFLRGDYYLNGPGRFHRGQSSYRHWLDGDGMITRVSFQSDGVECVNRFVRTEKLVEEEAAGRPVYRTFGTAFENDRLKPPGAATMSPNNVSVFRWNESLLAFGEHALPIRLDAQTLETDAEENFGGSLNSISPFSGHPKIDGVTGEMINFGISFSASRPMLTFYGLAESPPHLLRRTRVPIPGPYSVHDFGVSPRYAIFHLGPYVLDFGALRAQGKTTMESLDWEPQRGTRLLALSRETGEPVLEASIGDRYCLHHINSFEQEGLLIVDVVEYDQPIYRQYQEVPNIFESVGAGTPVRYELDLERRALVSRTELPPLVGPDFPAVGQNQSTRPYDEFWMLSISGDQKPGRKFFDQLTRTSWSAGGQVDIYQMPRSCYFGGEPVVVNDPNCSENSVVICPIFDAAARETQFAVFNAFDLASGPIARLQTPSPWRLGFHASFYPANDR